MVKKGRLLLPTFFIRKMERLNSNNDGFTLVELVVVTAVVGLMIISLGNLFIGIGSIQRQADRLAIADRIAEDKIESLRNAHYNTLTNSPPSLDFTNELPADLPTPRSGLITISEPNPGIKRLEVIITYKESSRTKTVQLSALIGNIGISQ